MSPFTHSSCVLSNTCSHYEKRTGPGRKSSSEHAIAFYEYILGSNDPDDNNNNKNENNNNDDDDDDNDGTDLDEEDFLNQHNDECDVCETGGELLCCSTCTLVFHLTCVRPKLEALPDGDWECPHCVISSAKKSSKAWKEAMLAVKQMEQLKETGGDDTEQLKEREEEKDSESSDDSEDDKTPKQKEEIPEGEARTKDLVTRKGDNKALYKISDSLSPILKVDPQTPTGRGKRSRRRPLMYQPQTVPASKWMSDAPRITEIAATEKDDNGDEKVPIEPQARRRPTEFDDDPANTEDDKEKPATTGDEPKDEDISNDNTGEKEVTCLFCQDDPKIPICVFCGCRSCYTKQCKDKLLVCGQCESEYHMFCLKPALTSVPVRKWFCPACRVAPASEAKVSTRRLSTSPLKTATGTRSSTADKEKTPPPKSTIVTTSPQSDDSPAKRPRGRPPKNKSSTSAATTTPSPLKRPRGRPPKNPQMSPIDEPVKRPRGRPPKNKSPISDVAMQSARKKPGPKLGSKNKRTLSASVEEPPPKKIRIEAAAARVLEPDPSEPVKISRSGRVVKRSSFHDEMEEGEQHLRTTRKDDSDDEMLPTYEELARGYNVEDVLGRDDEDDSDEVARPIRTKVIKPPNEVPLPPPAAPILQVNPPQMVVPLSVETRVLSDPISIPRLSTEKIPSEAIDCVHDPATVVEAPKSPLVSEAERTTSSHADVRPTPVRTIPSGGSAAAVASTPPPPLPLPTEPSKPISVEAIHSPATAASPSLTSRVLPPGPKVVQEPAGVSHADDACNAGPPYKLTVDVHELVKKAIANIPLDDPDEKQGAPTSGPVKVPRRKPGARECMQISRRFGNRVIPKKYMDILMDYCTRGKVEHLIRMRERLDEHAMYLESQLAGLETLVREKGETSVVVPPLPERAPLDPLLAGGTTKSYSPVNGGPAGSTSSAAPPSPMSSSGGVPPPPRLFSSSLQQQQPQTSVTSVSQQELASSGSRSSFSMVVPTPSRPALLSSSSKVAVSKSTVEVVPGHLPAATTNTPSSSKETSTEAPVSAPAPQPAVAPPLAATATAAKGS